jgi:hypothetical protein
VFDEVQHVPALFSYLQVKVDARPEAERFVLTNRLGTDFSTPAGSDPFGLQGPLINHMKLTAPRWKVW